MQKHLRKSLPMLFQITVSINFTYEKRVRIYNVIYLPEESDLMALFLFVARHSKLWIIEIIFILIKTTCTIKSPLFTLSNILPTSCYATSIIFTGTNINWMLANNFDCNAPVIKKKVAIISIKVISQFSQNLMCLFCINVVEKEQDGQLMETDINEFDWIRALSNSCRQEILFRQNATYNS